MGCGDEQPQSFDVLQAFVEPDDRALILKLLPEKFFSLDIDYILENLTDPDRIFGSEKLLALSDGVVHHVHIPGSYQQLQFVGAERLAFYGAAFVRHQEELSILGIAAKEGREVGLEPVDLSAYPLDPDREFLRMGRRTLNQNHAEFYNHNDLYPIIFLTRIDLVQKTSMVRFILEEREDTFEVFSDSRHIYTGMLKEQNLPVTSVSEMFEKSNRQLIKYDHVFRMIRDVPFVVIDVENDDETTVSRYPTELNLSKNTSNVRKIRSSLPASDVPNYVDVRSIIKAAGSGKTYNWDAGKFEVEQSGYWKVLEPGKVGIGKNGDRIHGRSWVTVKESWVEALGFEPPESGAGLHVQTVTDVADIGVLYVMRSASHPRDQYKIGFTIKDAYERAAQLYATSGQSDQFNVVEQWNVRSPRRVEALVHEKLAAFRVNPKREFFILKYDKIRKAVEEAIADLAASIDP